MIFFVLLGCFISAVFYASVGLGGATAYLGFLSLTSLTTKTIVVYSLILNIIGSFTAFIIFKKADFFDVKLLLPFIITSIPVSYFSAYIHIDKFIFTILVIMLLAVSAILIKMNISIKIRLKKKIKLILQIAIGAILGIVAGILGIGGGIFLLPILLLFDWADEKFASSTAGMFTCINSVFSLIGHLNNFSFNSFKLISILILLVALGAIIGANLGVYKFKKSVTKSIISLILLLLDVKLIFSLLTG